MHGPHPDSFTLSRLASGRLRGDRLVSLLEHLAGCPSCGSLFGRAALEGDGANGSAATDPSYERTLDQVTRRAGRFANRLRRERSTAAAGIAHLAPLPTAERRRALLAEPRLRTYAVAREALDLSSRSRTEDPELCEQLADLALDIVRSLEPRRYGKSVLEDLRGETWGAIGNARRIRNDLRRAAPAFETARGHAEAGSGDPLETAALASLYASYLRDTDRFDAAREHLDLAFTLYHDLGDRHLEGRTLISKALLERAAGRSHEALRLIESAPRLLDPARDARLVLAVRQNRALLLADLGHPERALRSLDGTDGPGTAAGPPGPSGSSGPTGSGRLDRLRVLWLRALLLEKLGRRDAARRAFTRARDGFAHAVVPVDVALLDLELSRLALEDGDRESALELAAGAFPAFAARQRSVETVRALELFRAAS